MQKSMSLKYEPSSDQLHISAKSGPGTAQNDSFSPGNLHQKQTVSVLHGALHQWKTDQIRSSTIPKFVLAPVRKRVIQIKAIEKDDLLPRIRRL